MNLRLGRPTRVLDLVRRGDQQRCQLWRQFVERAADQRRERGLEPQVPAQRSQCDGAHRRAILAFVRGFECRVRGPAFENDVVDGDRRRGQRFGARRVTGRARLGVADFAGLSSCTKPQARDAHGVGEITCGNRPLAGALQLANGEHTLAAGDPQAVVGKA